MKKQYEVLQWAFSFLANYGCEKNVANLLLQHLLQLDRNQFMLNMKERVSEEIIVQYESMIKQHAITGVPLQHLIGYAYFYGRKFFVNDRVLIPRFDTEVLVERTIIEIKGRFRKVDGLTIVDIGTGSGIIASTLALELPGMTVYATDISDRALKVAGQNAKNLKADVRFFKGDFLKPIIAKNINPDIIVSNPPYIRETDKDSLSETVKTFDPSIALFAGDDGLESYREILEQILELPKNPDRLILFEIGHDQADEIMKLIRQSYPNVETNVYQDLAQKDRVILIKHN